METYKIWLIKAQNDLKSCLKLAQGDEPILDTAVYHAQQTAEKALKAFLAYKEIEIPKIHDLRLLTEMCSEIDDSFSDLLNMSELLTPYATVYRYPDEILEPDKDETDTASEYAGKILSFVKKLITELEND